MTLISQDILKLSKQSIYHKEALLHGYQEYKKICRILFFCEIFRVIFEKVAFLKNGHGRHQMGAMPTHFVLVFHQTQ